MKITFLGTGTSTGNPRLLCDCPVCHSADSKDNRLRSSIYVESQGTSLLIDCGPDFRQQALRASIQKIDAVALTHEHYDHIGGLDDLRPFCNRHLLPIYGYRRVLDILKRNLPYGFSDIPYPDVPAFKVNPVVNKPVTIGNITLIPVALMHYKLPVMGIRIGDMAYLTDFNHIEPEELNKVKGVKVLIIDALRIEKHISHNNLEEALTIVEQIQPESAWLIHMSHEMGFHQQVETQLPAGVGLSWDGLVIEVS
jgi:phosphoribosyl 1,2-cyclic phosphate phosphodiesterase